MRAKIVRAKTPRAKTLRAKTLRATKRWRALWDQQAGKVEMKGEQTMERLVPLRQGAHAVETQAS